MGNTASSPAKNERSSSSSKRREKKESRESPRDKGITDKAKNLMSDMGSYVKSSVKKLDDPDHPAIQFLDNMCGVGYDDKMRSQLSTSFAYSEDMSEEDSRTASEDDTLDEYDRRKRSSKNKHHPESESGSMMSQSDYESEPSKKRSSKSRRRSDESTSFESEDESYKKTSAEPSVITDMTSDVGPGQLSKPLASSFAKRCYFTKAGIGKQTQHYEGLTLTGNVVLMLAAAMKLKGCPTICDEDLRRVEQTYPNQFSRLPDELLLSSGWRRISKYCHFSNKPIPDGVPFFHSKQRLHPNGGFYFLLAAAVGMVRPIDIEPLTRDTLVLLETDFPNQCDQVPQELIQDASMWTLVDKFCFFSGGPINTEEDVYYQADFEGNLIFMLAFLSPSLTPNELYKLTAEETDEPGLKSIREVEEVESVYDLTERDFEDLKLYHLGPCRALPPYILQPQAWTKVLPPHFLEARHTAMVRAQEYEESHCIVSPTGLSSQTVMSEEENAAEKSFEYGTPVQDGPEPVTFPEEPWVQNKPEEQFSQYESISGQNGFVGSSFGNHTAPMDANSYAPDQNEHYATSEATNQFESEAGSHFPPEPPTNPYPTEPSGYDGNSFQDTDFQERSIRAPEPIYQPSPTRPLPVTGFSPIQQPLAPEPAPSSDPEQRYNYYDTSATEAPLSPVSDDAHQTDNFRREAEEEGAFLDNSAPMDEAIATRSLTLSNAGSGSMPGSMHSSSLHGSALFSHLPPPSPSRMSIASRARSIRGTDNSVKMDPPEDEPPSLSRLGDAPEDLSHFPSEPSPEAVDEYYRGDGADEHESAYPSQNGFYDAKEYYETPGKDPGGSSYPAREEEYYDSPEGHETYSKPESVSVDDYAQYGPPLERSPQDDFEPSPDLHHLEKHDGYASPVNGGFLHERDYITHGEYFTPGAAETASASYAPRDVHDSGFSPDDPNDTGFAPREPNDAEYIASDHVENSYASEGTNEPRFPPETPPGDDGYSPQGDAEYFNSPGFTEDTPDNFKENERKFPSVHVDSESISVGFDLITPRSEVSVRTPSDFTPQSAAMRSAQDLLRKNRQKRLDMARRKSEQSHRIEPEPVVKNPEEESNGTWDSQSEMTSVISGSSVWTDSSNAGDRSSRRALILQMAKARMKTGREKAPSTASYADEKSKAPIMENIPTDPTKPVLSEKMEGSRSEIRSDVNTDLDFSDELD